MYMTGPSEVGGVAYIQDRLNPFPFFAVLIWLASRSHGPLSKRLAQLAAPSIALVLLVTHSLQYRVLNSFQDEYLSGKDLVQRNSTLLPIYFSETGDAPDAGALLSMLGDLLLHAASYIAVDR